MSPNKLIFRKDLYDLVWSVPLNKLSKDFNLTVSQLKEICEKHNVPVPENGYWSKLKFNKDIQKRPLEDVNYEINLPKSAEKSPLQEIIDEIISDPKAPIKVSSKLKNPDILITNTEEYTKRLKNDFYHRDDKVFKLSINVTDKNEKRAFRLMDALIKLLRYRGFSFEREYYSAKMVIDGIKIPFDLREHHRRVPNEASNYPAYKYSPTGNFILTTGEYSQKKEWTETSNIRLEEKIVRIVAWIEVKVQEEKEWREKARIAREIQEKEQKIKEEQEAKTKAEEEKFNKLREYSKKFEEYILIQKYILEVEKRAIAENNITEELKDWIEWANKKLEEMNPFNEGDLRQIYNV